MPTFGLLNPLFKFEQLEREKYTLEKYTLQVNSFSFYTTLN
jgi:hypothetical protein